MDRETLRKVQLTQLEIAKEIKRVCDENNIVYFLEGGTLLGAVRHQGFIPWDDDLDISMTRENYEKFIRIAPDKINNKYRIQTWDSSDYVPLPFAKVMKKGTVFLETYANPKANNEIWVDVFPRDHYPDDKGKQKQMRRNIQWLRHILTMKSGVKPWKRSENTREKLMTIIKYSPFLVLSPFFSRKWLKQKWYQEITRYNHSDTKQLSLASMFSIDKYVVPSKTIEEFCLLTFEDTTFNCPKDYDSYLRTIYNDYMQLPPVEERENKHSIIKVKL